MSAQPSRNLGQNEKEHVLNNYIQITQTITGTTKCVDVTTSKSTSSPVPNLNTVDNSSVFKLRRQSKHVQLYGYVHLYFAVSMVL